MKQGIEWIDYPTRWTKKQISEVVERNLKTNSQKDITNFVYNLLIDYVCWVQDLHRTTPKKEKIKKAKIITREFIVSKK